MRSLAESIFTGTSDVPIFAPEQHNEVRRFVTFCDVWYDARRALFLAEEVLAVAALRSDDPASLGELRRPARADAARASGNGAAIPEGARIVRLTSR